MPEANELMQSAMSRIEIAYAAETHAEIHEASYGLEAAAARIAESGEVDAEGLGHLIEILHLGSEVEDQAILSAVMPRLSKAVTLALGQPES